MRVLLIDPWDKDQLPPPSIGYLQSALKKYEVNVEAKNINDVTSWDYDLIGVSYHSFSVNRAKQIRDKYKGHLICGGHHPSALPEQMLSIGYDQVIIGEGENAIIDIINGNSDKVINNCEYKYFDNLNDIPIPDYSGFNFSSPHGIHIISSRGCPFSCTFCGSSNFWGHRLKMMSSENVILEIEKRKSEGYNTWIFYDDNFTANKKRVYEICSQLDGSMIWECTSRAESLDEELCKELYRAGCRVVHLGIESLSQDALDRMGKNTTVEKMLKGIEVAESAGIHTFSLFLVGLPGDKIENVEETHKNRLKSKITQFGTNICWVLPGTHIHKKAKEHGFNDEVYLESGTPFYTYEHSLEELTRWANRI